MGISDIFTVRSRFYKRTHYLISNNSLMLLLSHANINVHGKPITKARRGRPNCKIVRCGEYILENYQHEIELGQLAIAGRSDSSGRLFTRAKMHSHKWVRGCGTGVVRATHAIAFASLPAFDGREVPQRCLVRSSYSNNSLLSFLTVFIRFELPLCNLLTQRLKINKFYYIKKKKEKISLQVNLMFQN